MFEITKGEKTVGTDGLRTMQVDSEGTMFKRRAIKWAREGQKEIEWLVASLDGVNVYLQDDKIIVTKENLRP
jgi:hypothetical protein